MCSESETKLSRHHVSDVHKAMKKDISRNKVSKPISRLVSLRLTEQRILSNFLLYRVQWCTCKRVINTETQYQTVAGAGPRKPLGSLYSWSFRIRSTFIQNQVSHFFLFLTLIPLYVSKTEKNYGGM